MAENNADAAPAGVRWLTVSEHHEGQRLDNFLLRELPGVPRSRLYRALRKGEVRVNKGDDIAVMGQELDSFYIIVT